MSNTNERDFRENSGLHIDVIEHSQYAKSILQQDKQYVPIAAFYSNYGSFRRELINPVLPVSPTGRNRLNDVLRNMENGGVHFNEGKLVRMFSMLGSQLIAYHRNAMRFSNEIADYGTFGPLNYLRYATRVATNISDLHFTEKEIDYTHTVDYMLKVLISAYADVSSRLMVNAVVDIPGVPTSEQLNIDDYAKYFSTGTNAWKGNPDLYSSFNKLSRYMTISVGKRFEIMISKLLPSGSEMISTFITLAEAVMSSINDMARTIAGAITDHVLSGYKATGDKRSMGAELDNLSKNSSLLDVYSLAFMMSIKKIGDVSNFANAQETEKETTKRLGQSAFTSDYGVGFVVSDLAIIGVKIDGADPSEMFDSIANFDISEWSALTATIFSYLNVAHAADIEFTLPNGTYDVLSKQGYGLFGYQLAGHMLDYLANGMSVNSTIDKIEDYFTSLGGALGDLIASGDSLAKNKVLSITGVNSSDKLKSLDELSKQIDRVIEGRDAVIDYYKHLDTYGTEAIGNIAGLLREYDIMCSSLANATSKPQAITHVDAFMDSKAWKNSGAHKLHTSAFSHSTKPTDADSLMQQMIVDHKVINAFNQSIFADFATVKSVGTTFPGQEFSLGRHLIIEYKGELDITGIKDQQIFVNGTNGFNDVYSLVIGDLKKKEIAQKLSAIYNVKLQQCLSDDDILRQISRPTGSTLASNYSFPTEVHSSVFTSVIAIETAIRYEMSCYKYAVKGNIAQMLLAHFDMLRSLEVALKNRELNFYTETSVERVREVLVEMKANIKQMISDLNVKEAVVRDDELGSGIPNLIVDGQPKVDESLDLLLSFFNEKANRLWYRDTMRNIHSLVTRLDTGKADVRNFTYLIDIAPSNYSAEYATLTKFDEELERLNVDPLANLLPDEGMTEEVKDTTHRSYTKAHFLYMVNLEAAFSQRKLDKILNLEETYTQDLQLPAGLDYTNRLPASVFRIMAIKISNVLKDRYISSADASERANKLYMLRGYNTNALMKIGTGFGELAEYGLSNESLAGVAYSVKSGFEKILAEIGMHPESIVQQFEVPHVLEYVYSMSRHHNFPFRLTAQGVKERSAGTANDVKLSRLNVSAFGSPDNSKFKIQDLFELKPTFMRTSSDMAGTVFHYNLYLRDEKAAKLLNSDIIEYNSSAEPVLMAMSPRDGLREFYTTQEEFVIVQGDFDADVRRSVSGGQALSVVVGIAEAVFEKVFSGAGKLLTDKSVKLAKDPSADKSDGIDGEGDVTKE